jgi:hypothetical protein
MVDKLKSDVRVSAFANFLSMLGFSRLVDNYGNSTSGSEIACVGKLPVQLNSRAVEALHLAIAPYTIDSALRFDGEIPITDGAESPLKTMCRVLDEKAHARGPDRSRHK